VVEYTKQILSQDRVRIIGVCFGHQIVGRAMGAPVGRGDSGWEVSVLPLDLSDAGKGLFQREKLVCFQRIAARSADVVYRACSKCTETPCRRILLA
jgi:GMP synthase-like glutamine amidotransferase